MSGLERIRAGVSCVPRWGDGVDWGASHQRLNSGAHLGVYIDDSSWIG